MLALFCPNCSSVYIKQKDVTVIKKEDGKEIRATSIMIDFECDTCHKTHTLTMQTKGKFTSVFWNISNAQCEILKDSNDNFTNY